MKNYQHRVIIIFKNTQLMKEQKRLKVKQMLNLPPSGHKIFRVQTNSQKVLENKKR